MSAIWKRMVRSAKTALKAILGSQTVTGTVLQTLLTEVERMLNGRALTANSGNPNDFQPLTPAHFLMQRHTICLPLGIFERADAFQRKKVETGPNAGRPLLEEVAKEILSYVADQRQMAQSPNQIKAKCSCPVGQRSLSTRTLESWSGS